MGDPNFAKVMVIVIFMPQGTPQDQPWDSSRNHFLFGLDKARTCQQGAVHDSRLSALYRLVAVPILRWGQRNQFIKPTPAL